MIIKLKKNHLTLFSSCGSKFWLFQMILVLIVGGCSITPKPLTVSDLEKSAKEDHRIMFEKGDKISGNLSLEEAIARALKYNLDHRARAMEQALALNQLDLEGYQLLPKLIAKAGYSDRSQFSATNSKERGDGPGSTSGYSYSADRSGITGDLALSWNVLDFGVSYFNARQNADRSLIAEEHRRKVVHNLVREVQYSYWRMVAAQKLKGRVKLAIFRAEEALTMARKVEQEKLRKPTEMLRYQKQLLQNIRRLETVNQKLATARVEVAALINVPPSTEFRVVPPLTDALAIPDWSLSLAKMEALAFQNNPDIREKLYLSRINIDDSRKSIVGLLPGINLSGGRNYDSNSFLDINRWYQWSSTLSLNVMKLLSVPSQIKYNNASKALSNAQRVALRMAVLAQVHVADMQYFSAVKQFKRAHELFLIDQRLSEQVSKRQESDIQSLLDRVSQETATIDSVMRRYQTYSEVIASVGRLHSTLGLSIFKPGVQADGLKSLTRNVAKAMQDRMSGISIELEIKMLDSKKSIYKNKNISVSVKKGLFSKLLNWSKSYLSTESKGFEGEIEKGQLKRNNLVAVSNIESVKVSLNKTIAGGALHNANVLCGSVSQLRIANGWVKISAKSVAKRRVEGWMHQVYSTKLRQQCESVDRSF